MFPALEELHSSFNKIDHITKVDSTLEKLKLLTLESNPLYDWEDILKLAHLPQ